MRLRHFICLIAIAAATSAPAQETCERADPDIAVQFMEDWFRRAIPSLERVTPERFQHELPNEQPSPLNRGAVFMPQVIALIEDERGRVRGFVKSLGTEALSDGACFVRIEMRVPSPAVMERNDVETLTRRVIEGDDVRVPRVVRSTSFVVSPGDPPQVFPIDAVRHNLEMAVERTDGFDAALASVNEMCSEIPVYFEDDCARERQRIEWMGEAISSLEFVDINQSINSYNSNDIFGEIKGAIKNSSKRDISEITVF